MWKWEVTHRIWIFTELCLQDVLHKTHKCACYASLLGGREKEGQRDLGEQKDRIWYKPAVFLPLSANVFTMPHCAFHHSSIECNVVKTHSANRKCWRTMMCAFHGDKVMGDSFFKYLVKGEEVTVRMWEHIRHFFFLQNCTNL